MGRVKQARDGGAQMKSERLSLLESGPVLGVSPHTIRAWAEHFLAANRVEARTESRGR
jgi:hypothetical protein